VRELECRLDGRARESVALHEGVELAAIHGYCAKPLMGGIVHHAGTTEGAAPLAETPSSAVLGECENQGCTFERGSPADG
jgi:hypothetical protein